jgi:hypothetical protein
MRCNNGSRVDSSGIRISSEVTWPGEPPNTWSSQEGSFLLIKFARSLSRKRLKTAGQLRGPIKRQPSPHSEMCLAILGYLVWNFPYFSSVIRKIPVYIRKGARPTFSHHGGPQPIWLPPRWQRPADYATKPLWVQTAVSHSTETPSTRPSGSRNAMCRSP